MIVVPLKQQLGLKQLKSAQGAKLRGRAGDRGDGLDRGRIHRGLNGDCRSEAVAHYADAAGVYLLAERDEVGGRHRVVALSGSPSKFAFAEADAAEVEPENAESAPRKLSGYSRDDAIVHVTAVSGMGMAHHHAGALGIRRIGNVQQPLQEELAALYFHCDLRFQWG